MKPRDPSFITYTAGNKYSTFILCVLVVGFFMQTYSRFLFSVAKIPYVNYDSYQYSLLAGPLITIAYTVTPVLVGHYLQKNRVSVLALIMGTSSIILASFSLTTNFLQISLLMITLGAAMSGYVPVASSIIRDYFPLQMRGVAMGLFNTGVFAGYGASLGFGTWVYELVDWKWSYLIPATLGAVLAFLIKQTIKEPQRTQNKDLKQGESLRAFSTVNWSDVYQHWKTVPSIFMLSIAGGVRNAAGFCWAYYAAQFFSSEFVKGNTKCSFSYSPTWYDSQDCNSRFPFCVEGLCSALSDTPWHDVGMKSARFEEWISWVVLVGGATGSVMGGLISDVAAKGRGTIGRIFVVIVLTACAVPCAVGALELGYPWCFVSLLFCFLFSECWLGILLNSVVELVPKEFAVSSVAAYLFVVANFGGNAPLLVPMFKQLFDEKEVISFQARPMISESFYQNQTGTVQFNIYQNGSIGLRKALLVLWPGLYFMSVFLFSLTYIWIKKDFEEEVFSVSAAERYGKSGLHEEDELLMHTDPTSITNS